VANAHRTILGEVDLEAMRDLFWTPCARPPSMLPSLSGFLCLRHIMTHRSQYAEKTQAACEGGHHS
jgi:hypothetical protein